MFLAASCIFIVLFNLDLVQNCVQFSSLKCILNFNLFFVLQNALVCDAFSLCSYSGITIKNVRLCECVFQNGDLIFKKLYVLNGLLCLKIKHTKQKLINNCKILIFLVVSIRNRMTASQIIVIHELFLRTTLLNKTVLLFKKITGLIHTL